MEAPHVKELNHPLSAARLRFTVVKLLAAFHALAALVGCEPAELRISTDGSHKLRFSADTVLFDTVFTSIGSITKRLNIYNDARDAVVISSIALAAGAGSSYNLNILGEDGAEFSEVRLLGNDSLLVLVDVLIDPQNQNLPYVVEDTVLFLTNNNLQSVRLVSWGQDAHFLNDSIISGNVAWSGDRPYVIYNSILIDTLATLTVQPGTRIFSHFGSSIFVQGKIRALGLPDNRIIFSNDRFEEKFQNAPGQWEGIFFLEGSMGNEIGYTDVRNAQYGIWLGTPDSDTIPDLVLDGVRIENMVRSGLIAFTSDLVARNTLVNNCGDFTVANLAGGHYLYEHCTFANSSLLFFRDLPLFAASDILELSDGSIISGSLSVAVVNCIFWGDRIEELVFDDSGGEEFTISFQNTIVKSQLAFPPEAQVIQNSDPLFSDIVLYDYTLDSLSPAIDAGQDLGISMDLLGVSRDSLPDLGALERNLRN